MNFNKTKVAIACLLTWLLILITIPISSLAQGEPEPLYTHPGSARIAQLNSEWNLLLTHENAVVRLWNLETGELIHEINPRDQLVIWDTYFSPDESRFVIEYRTTAPRDVIAGYDVESGEQVFQLITAGTYVAAYSPDESRIVAGSGTEHVRVWDIETSELILDLYNPTHDLQHRTNIYPYWSPDGSRILAVSNSEDCQENCIHSVYMWDSSTGENLFTLDFEQLVSAYWNPQGNQIATVVLYDPTAQIWDANTGEELFNLLHEDRVWTVEWNSDSTRILTETDKVVYVWDTDTGEELFILPHEDWVYATWKSDSTQILTRTESAVYIWDASTGEKMLTLTPEIPYVTAAFWSSNETLIATCSNSPDSCQENCGHNVALWDATTGEVVLTLPFNSVVTMQWSPDGTRFMTKMGRTVSIWAVE